MGKIGKVLFFKIIAICVSVCLFVDITAYAMPNLRVNSMFDEIDKLEEVGRVKRLTLYLKKLFTKASDRAIRRELRVELRKAGLIIDKVQLLKTKQLIQLLEMVKILPHEHVKTIQNIKVKNKGLCSYEPKSMKKLPYIKLGRLANSIDESYAHEIGHSVYAQLLEIENSK